MLNYSSFCLSAAGTGLFTERPDVVIASSPQLLVGLSGWWLARCKRARFIFEVRDLWPESLAAVGVGTADSLVYRTLARIAGFLYRNSDHIVVVTPAFKEYLVEHMRVRPEKISVIENGVEAEVFTPKAEGDLRSSWGLRENLSSPILEPWATPTACRPWSRLRRNCKTRRLKSCSCWWGKGRRRSNWCLGSLPRSHQPALCGPAIAAEDTCLYLRVGCVRGLAQEERDLQDRHSQQDAGVYVLRPPGDSWGRGSGAPDSGGGAGRNLHRAGKFRRNWRRRFYISPGMRNCGKPWVAMDAAMFCSVFHAATLPWRISTC